MRKELLLKHIKGETSPQENMEVREWIELSGENRKYYKNLKNVWISQSLPSGIVPQEEAMNAVAMIKMLSRRNNRRFKRYFQLSVSIASAAVIALCVVVWRYEFNPAGTKMGRVELSYLPQEYKHTVYTEKGVKATIVLPDSSKVWLNSESEITYPDKFTGTSREISFKGEGYFKVRKDSLCPMIINTNKGFIIEVTGTEFNVKSYDDDKSASATLYSGRINLVSKSEKNGQAVRKEMLPFETCIIDSNKALNITVTNRKTAENTKAWREGRLIFSATPMSEVVKILKRWHGVDIVVEDPVILDYKITADFNSESMVQVAQILKFCALVDYKIEGDKFIFFGR